MVLTKQQMINFINEYSDSDTFEIIMAVSQPYEDYSSMGSVTGSAAQMTRKTAYYEIHQAALTITARFQA